MEKNMIAPITAVVPVDTVMQTAHKGISSPAMEQLTQKFDALMKAPQPHHTAPPFQPHEPNAVAQVMDKQETMMRQSFADVDKLTANMDHMSTHELMIAGMQISRSMAMGSMGMQATMGVAQGSGKALQSLLKNQ
jgi:type III secretion system HrpB2-like protein